MSTANLPQLETLSDILTATKKAIEAFNGAVQNRHYVAEPIRQKILAIETQLCSFEYELRAALEKEVKSK